MTQINLRKIERNVYLAFLAIVLLFTVGAWNSIQAFTGFESAFMPNGLNLSLTYFVIVALLFVALVLIFAHIRRMFNSGRNCFGLKVIDAVHKYRFLMEQLVIRDFKIKYKRSVLGVFWSFLNPLLMMVVQYIVFSRLLNLRSAGMEHYAIYLLCGIVIWNGFSDSTQQSMRAIHGNARLITKVYVPKYIYPISKVVSSFINVVLSMVPLLLVTVIYGLFNGLYLKLSVILLPFALLLLLIFIIGMGFMLSTLMVFFHDIEFLWSVILMAWMYATPIIYSLDMFGEGANWLRVVMQFNPMYHFINFVRSILLSGTAPSFPEMGVCLLCALGMFFLGLFIFKKNQDRFILYL